MVKVLVVLLIGLFMMFTATAMAGVPDHGEVFGAEDTACTGYNCPHCGNEVSTGQSKCSECGYDLT